MDKKEIETAKAVFLADSTWKDIYDRAPEGAKRRLEISFWFTVNHRKWTGNQAGAAMVAYREWRTEVERTMTDEDLEYMISTTDKEAAREHFVSLLKDRKAAMRTPSGPMMVWSYDEFFDMLAGHGEFESPACDDEAKKAIVAEFISAVEGSGDPLETHVEDILATAAPMEVRIYPDGVKYVRAEVRFLTETAEWSQPYQMVAAWDSVGSLKAYTFPVGKGRKIELPYEMEDPPTDAQKEKRMQLMASRLSSLPA